MANFLFDILDAAGDEEIIGIKFLNARGYDNDIPFDGELVSFQEAVSVLDYTYDTGYGGQDCHSIYAWTPTRILFVGEYDGSTWIEWRPRNPG